MLAAERHRTEALEIAQAVGNRPMTEVLEAAGEGSEVARKTAALGTSTVSLTEEEEPDDAGARELTGSCAPSAGTAIAHRRRYCTNCGFAFFLEDTSGMLRKRCSHCGYYEPYGGESLQPAAGASFQAAYHMVTRGHTSRNGVRSAARSGVRGQRSAPTAAITSKVNDRLSCRRVRSVLD